MPSLVTGDWWENFEDRHLMPVWRFLLNESRFDACLNKLEIGVTYKCTRPPGHNGRHVGRSHTKIAAAWPGDLPPTVDDLL